MSGQQPRGPQTQGPLKRQIDASIEALRERLDSAGQMTIESGLFDAGCLRGSMHTDLGPEQQDKDMNQDYALAWSPRDESTPIRFALALADGLTSSFRAEWASALACWTALATLMKASCRSTRYTPHQLAQSAFNAAGEALRELADQMANDPEAFRPPDVFASTWRYILRKRTLLETTLSLAWAQDDLLHIAVLGDGGVLWRRYAGARRPAASVQDDLFLGCDPQTDQVRALGPASPTVDQFDYWASHDLRGRFLGALYTDGIGRGIGDKPEVLLTELEELEALSRGTCNAAREIIERGKQRPAAFADNLTLAVLHSNT